MLMGWQCDNCGVQFELYPAHTRRGAIEDHQRRCGRALTPQFAKLQKANRLDILLALTSLFETLETSA
jgi:hypothetical protein